MSQPGSASNERSSLLCILLRIKGVATSYSPYVFGPLALLIVRDESERSGEPIGNCMELIATDVAMSLVVGNSIPPLAYEFWGEMARLKEGGGPWSFSSSGSGLRNGAGLS